MTRGEFPWRAAGVAVLTLTPFAGYALLTTPMYSATAQIFLEAPVVAGEELPPVTVAAQRLRETGLDPEVLARIGRELDLDASSASEALLRERLREQLSVTGAAGGVYDVTFRDSNARRAALVCNLVAGRAAARATHGLLGDTAKVTQQPAAAQALRKQELAAFLQAHPELVAPPAPSAERQTAEGAQATKLAIERDLLQVELEAKGPADASDNPYDEPAGGDENQRLRRRLREIDSELARLKRRAAAPATPKPTPEVEREWRRLSASVEAASLAPPPAPLLHVRLAEANVPTTPLNPDRRLALLVGVVVSILSGFLMTLHRKGRPKGAPATPREPVMPKLLPAHTSSAPPERSTSTLPERAPSAPPAHSSHPPVTQADADAAAREKSDPPYQPSRPPPATREAEAVLAEAMLGGDEPPRKPAIAPAPVRAVGAAPGPPPAEAEQTPVGHGLLERVSARHGRTLSGFAPVPVVPMLMTPLPERPDAPTPAVNVPPQRAPIVEETVEAIASVEWDPRREPSAEPRRQASRRTQALGSMMQPEARSRTPVPSAPLDTNPPSPQGQGYLSTPPPPRAPVQSRHLSTPPYYGQMPGTQSSNAASPLPVAAPSRPAPLARAGIRAHRVHSTWSPNPELRLETRRPLSDELFPYAVEGCFVIGVTGVPETRGQKTRVAAELALALAEARRPRVLLLEGDFHWPGVHQLLRIEMPFAMGFSQQLRTRSGSEDWAVVECAPSLHVLAEGLMRSPGMLLSRHFEDGLASFRAYYDFVVVSGPLASDEIDCRALDSVVDGVVVVSPNPGSPGLQHALSLFPEKRYSAVVGMA